jgi:hypothetical protein|tara:strand:- start:106 stop:408 length:303 start_codon:yes stop_codon:yes gene_type:complete
MNERVNKYMTDYERYLILSSYESRLSGGYQGYIAIKDVIKVLEQMSQKQQTTYLYNDKFYVSSLTITEINTILDCWNDGTYRTGLKKVKLVANQMGVRNI